MVLVLLQPTHDHHRHHTLHALHANRHRAAVDRILCGNVLAHAKLGLERGLVAGILAVHEPGAAAPPQHRVALARDPHLVVGHGAGARHALEHHLADVGERDGDDRRRGEGQQPAAEQVAEDPGVLGGEGGEGEGVTVGTDGVQLWGLGLAVWFWHRLSLSGLDNDRQELASSGGLGMLTGDGCGRKAFCSAKACRVQTLVGMLLGVLFEDWREARQYM